jgi:hypothetical protein
MLEIKNKDIIYWFNSIRLPLNRTTIYLSRPFKTRSIFFYPGGVFFPGLLVGYVFPSQIYDEIIRRYAHEASHGAFFENVPVGRLISEIDKSILDEEMRIFGGGIDYRNIIVYEEDITGSKRLTIDEARERFGETYGDGYEYWSVGRKEFEEYKRKTSLLQALLERYLDLIEGFAVFCESRILGINFYDQIPKEINRWYRFFADLKPENISEFLQSIKYYQEN